MPGLSVRSWLRNFLLAVAGTGPWLLGEGRYEATVITQVAPTEDGLLTAQGIGVLYTLKCEHCEVAPKVWVPRYTSAELVANHHLDQVHHVVIAYKQLSKQV